MEKDLAVHRANRFAGEGEEDRAGKFFHWARPRGHRGQAARRRRAHPLGSAHAGEGASGGAMATPPFVALASLALGRCCAVLRRDEVERGESGEEERERAKEGNGLGFGGRGCGRGFVLPIRARDRPIRTNGARCTGQLAAQAGARGSATLPAQAQVVAWVRPARAR